MFSTSTHNSIVLGNIASKSILRPGLHTANSLSLSLSLSLSWNFLSILISHSVEAHVPVDRSDSKLAKRFELRRSKFRWFAVAIERDSLSVATYLVNLTPNAYVLFSQGHNFQSGQHTRKNMCLKIQGVQFTITKIQNCYRHYIVIVIIYYILLLLLLLLVICLLLLRLLFLLLLLIVICLLLLRLLLLLLYYYGIISWN